MGDGVEMNSETREALLEPTDKEDPEKGFRGNMTEVEAEGDETIAGALKDLLMDKKFVNWMLIFIPISFVANYAKMWAWFNFIAAFLALIPLAGLLGDVTELVAAHTSAVVGALLNASFGNATELIISVLAINKGELDLVLMALVGSVLGNMLLVLGTAFIVAGTRGATQKFNPTAVDSYCSVLLLSVACLAVPTVVGMSDYGFEKGSELSLTVSRAVSVVMVFLYFIYMVFQLKTHTHLFIAEDEGDDEDLGPLPLPLLVGLLAVLTLLISFHSDFLVDAVKPTAEDLKISYLFIGVIMVPIVGNVAEHAAAVMLAYRGKMDVAIGIAVGSSIQIALFMTPFMVLVSWIMQKDLTLNFHKVSMAFVILATLIVKSICQDGSSNWFEGVLLVGFYTIVGLTFIFLPGIIIV